MEKNSANGTAAVYGFIGFGRRYPCFPRHLFLTWVLLALLLLVWPCQASWNLQSVLAFQRTPYRLRPAPSRISKAVFPTTFRSASLDVGTPTMNHPIPVGTDNKPAIAEAWTRVGIDMEQNDKATLAVLLEIRDTLKENWQVLQEQAMINLNQQNNGRPSSPPKKQQAVVIPPLFDATPTYVQKMNQPHQRTDDNPQSTAEAPIAKDNQQLLQNIDDPLDIAKAWQEVDRDLSDNDEKIIQQLHQMRESWSKLVEIAKALDHAEDNDNNEVAIAELYQLRDSCQRIEIVATTQQEEPRAESVAFPSTSQTPLQGNEKTLPFTEPSSSNMHSNNDYASPPPQPSLHHEISLKQQQLKQQQQKDEREANAWNRVDANMMEGDAKILKALNEIKGSFLKMADKGLTFPTTSTPATATSTATTAAIHTPSTTDIQQTIVTTTNKEATKTQQDTTTKEPTMPDISLQSTTIQPAPPLDPSYQQLDAASLSPAPPKESLDPWENQANPAGPPEQAVTSKAQTSPATAMFRPTKEFWEALTTFEDRMENYNSNLLSALIEIQNSCEALLAQQDERIMVETAKNVGGVSFGGMSPLDDNLVGVEPGPTSEPMESSISGTISASSQAPVASSQAPVEAWLETTTFQEVEAPQPMADTFIENFYNEAWPEKEEVVPMPTQLMEIAPTQPTTLQAQASASRPKLSLEELLYDPDNLIATFLVSSAIGVAVPLQLYHSSIPDNLPAGTARPDLMDVLNSRAREAQDLLESMSDRAKKESPSVRALLESLSEKASNIQLPDNYQPILRTQQDLFEESLRGASREAESFWASFTSKAKDVSDPKALWGTLAGKFRNNPAPTVPADDPLGLGTGQVEADESAIPAVENELNDSPSLSADESASPPLQTPDTGLDQIKQAEEVYPSTPLPELNPNKAAPSVLSKEDSIVPEQESTPSADEPSNPGAVEASPVWFPAAADDGALSTSASATIKMTPPRPLTQQTPDHDGTAHRHAAEGENELPNDAIRASGFHFGHDTSIF
ncbi:expressed unknown protein [Seminavis robusta]|uniref:Uncharacterized protein n=1 Tax=Seminavis robusta TaxID=568900 RepID=A0A9N8HIH7_9STRA|nr:expressed unknown protein [Seminavis robusta]|eukprot:Sro595_g172680.1 n/a (1024) ;mRNA; f:45691-48873